MPNIRIYVWTIGWRNLWHHAQNVSLAQQVKSDIVDTWFLSQNTTVNHMETHPFLPLPAAGWMIYCTVCVAIWNTPTKNLSKTVHACLILLLCDTQLCSLIVKNALVIYLWNVIWLWYKVKKRIKRWLSQGLCIQFYICCVLFCFIRVRCIYEFLLAWLLKCSVKT